jgi:hypothetical protein
LPQTNPTGRIGEAFGPSTAPTPRITSAQYLLAYLLPPKPFGGLTKCLFPRNTEVLKQQVMVIAFGDLIKHAALARASHPTGLTIARIKTTSRLIRTRRSGGVRSSLVFGPRCGLRTVGTDMVGLHIGFRTRPRPVPTEPDRQDRNSSTPKAPCSRLDRILLMSGNRAPSASVA